ncbi:MAG: ATPase [gamma proteobacterium symbiont of Ctena orbiculata]|nr:MAG: ATPase [gamma proteobacterium symbiont of Ctena orbiculata]PVV22863.1 MAG: ATPase [gamma proteobacterium symbiont of Ctena orbiculata]PVV26597.1 MAG: ATPase [gamma proteobacterium symbiont of Ctena orbiculata]
MSDLQDLELIIRSGTSIIFIESDDEKQVETLFERLANQLGRQLLRWTVASGLTNLHTNQISHLAIKEPARVLAEFAGRTAPAIYMLMDVHHWLDDPLTLRQLKEIALGNRSQTLVLVSHNAEIPDELRSLSARFELSLPDRNALKNLLQAEIREWGRHNNRNVKAKREVIEPMLSNLSGLSLRDARQLIRNAIYDDGMLTETDLDDLAKTKYRLLDNTGVLSLELDSAKFSQVAGLGNLKRWLEQRREIFINDGAPSGLDLPKGILLLGVQGGGKSLAAKSVAGSWHLPLLRLDFATLYNKYYGETERNLRDSLKTAESMAPCVLWIDEIEKGLATDDDGGPSKRILGTLLIWMAERDSRVFLVATANDIEMLPPELLRKGRFDEVFFVDLPDAEIREAIFAIHLAKREQNPDAFDMKKLQQASEGFSGAEIEQAIVAALYTSHASRESLDTAHILSEIEQTRPLSVLMAEKIAHLRSWAAQRTVTA